MLVTKKIIYLLVICVVVMSAVFVPVSASDFPFTDVQETGWQYKPVKRVYDLGIMNGVSDTCFDPNKRLTRAEAAMILYNLEGEAASYIKYSFKDVKTGAWYADAVEWMYKRGIAKGITDEYFGVNEYITRQDFITFIYRMYEDKWNLTGKNNSIYIRDSIIYSFKDSWQIAEYAMPAMKLSAGICMIVTRDPISHCNVEPIIKGYNGFINPRSNCTRAEAAVIIGNAYTIDKYA